MPDIFISFAHNDNLPVSGEEKGWITHFINNLRNEVSRKMGRVEDYQLWMDFCLKGSDEITPEIDKQLGETYALIILLSSSWLASEWCQRELKIFSRHLKHTTGRIFVVELDRISTEEKPAILHDLLTYRFWKETDQNKVRQLGYPVPQPTDTAYYDRLADLSHELATALKNKKQETSVQAAKATVYIAPVNDSLYEQRASLISELRQFGIDVLPRNNNTVDGNMDSALAQCSHFVQLLDTFWTMGVPVKQYETAEATAKPIMQWRDPKLDLTDVQLREEQKKLLNGKTVIAAPLADFIRFVRETVLPKPKSEEERALTSQNDKQMVFVHAGQDDLERARSVAQVLMTKGYCIALPCYQGNAERIRKSIERGYQFCDVMLMLQHTVPTEVVEDYLSEARVHTMQRSIKPPILICQCGKAEELCFIPPGVVILVCHNNFDKNCVEQFLEEMNA